MTVNPIVADMMQRRTAAGYSIRVTFGDGTPDFTGHYRTVLERNAKMAAARRIPGFLSVEIIACLPGII